MTLETFYQQVASSTRAMAVHLPRLRAAAAGCELAVEFGVKRGGSASALLLGAARVISYDIEETAEARRLEAIAGDRWSYRIEDSRTADVPACDLLFVDSLHTYAQVRSELVAHADQVRRTLIFHDVLTFGAVGARGETGEQLWSYRVGESVPFDCLGIRPAIDELMIRDPSWRMTASYVDSHGLLVLERRS